MQAGRHPQTRPGLRLSRRACLKHTGALAGGLALAGGSLPGCAPPGPQMFEPPAGATGLDFPGSRAVPTTLRFRFWQPLPPYPATYLWRAWPRQQDGYYTAFFWGNDDGLGDLRTFYSAGNHDTHTYYGAHPYPDPPPRGSRHYWEISVEEEDYRNGRVVYDRWYAQAFRTWASARGKHHEFYWDLPRTDDLHRVVRHSPPDWGEALPPVPALTFGDAPWAPGNEVWNGILRGFQVYAARLTLAEILAELETPLSTPAGRAGIWYLNVNPTPSDLADRAGQGHDPEWVGDLRPALWTA